MLSTPWMKLHPRGHAWGPQRPKEGAPAWIGVMGEEEVTENCERGRWTGQGTFCANPIARYFNGVPRAGYGASLGEEDTAESNDRRRPKAKAHSDCSAPLRKLEVSWP